MYSSSYGLTVLRVATWAYIGSLVAVGSLALLSLCAGLFGMALHAATTLLPQVGG